MSKNITIVLGHPDATSFNGKLAEQYMKSAKAAGHNVKLFKTGEMDFDPILHQGYKVIQNLEPCLVEISEAMKWANHLVFVFPIWWGTPPAILKGLFERMWLPDYSFKILKESAFPAKLMTGRSADLLVTMDTPAWFYRLFYSKPGIREMKKNILEFCGIKPVRVTTFSPMITTPEEKRAKWLAQVDQLARRA
jgi:NAD(P)H dehydrogenase (quinone)